MNQSEKTLDKIVALCKNRGYIYAGSEIYGGLANSWDYGPLGTEFKNNVIRPSAGLQSLQGTSSCRQADRRRAPGSKCGRNELR